MRFDDPTVPRAAVQATHTIVEKGMSPAEAVKLLAEFEAAAREKIIAALHVENQLLNGEVLIEREPSLQRNRLTMKMKLNGRERLIEFNINDWGSDVPAEKLDVIRTALASRMVEVLIDELTGPIVSAIYPRNFAA